MWWTSSTSTAVPSFTPNSLTRSGSSAVTSIGVRAYSVARASTSPPGTPRSTSKRTSGASTIRWYGSPSRGGYTVRSTSCRSTTSRTAASSTPGSGIESSRSTTGALYADDGPSSRLRNHSRRWA